MSTQQEFSSRKVPGMREAPIKGMMRMDTDQELLSKSADVFRFKQSDRKRAEAKDAAEWPFGKL